MATKKRFVVRCSARQRVWLSWMAVAVLLPAIGGCSRGAPQRFPIRGTITMGGEPVPAGEILFEPDTAKGGSGLGTIALIRNGRYETPSGRGHAGGPHVLRITAYDGKANVELMKDYGALLFHDHRHHESLPRASSTLDLAIPSPAEIKAAAGPRAASW